MPEHFDTGQKGHSAECSEAGGGLVVELVAEVLELLLALPFLPRDSSSVCVAT